MVERLPGAVERLLGVADGALRARDGFAQVLVDGVIAREQPARRPLAALDARDDLVDVLRRRLEVGDDAPEGTVVEHLVEATGDLAEVAHPVDGRVAPEDGRREGLDRARALFEEEVVAAEERERRDGGLARLAQHDVTVHKHRDHDVRGRELDLLDDAHLHAAVDDVVALLEPAHVRERDARQRLLAPEEDVHAGDDDGEVDEEREDGDHEDADDDLGENIRILFHMLPSSAGNCPP